MAVQSIKKGRQYQEREAMRGPTTVVASIALFGVAAVLLIVALMKPQQGTMMGAIQSVMRGLGGDMMLVLPLTAVWAGLLCALSTRGRRVSPLKVAADVLAALFVLAGVHMFFAHRIVIERMSITGFANFVAQSYRYGHGGGAIGALFCWPLYSSIGVVGGFIAALLAIVLLMTATGRVSRLVSFAEEHVPARPQRNNFEKPSPAPGGRKRPAPRRGQQRRPRPNRDPYSESAMGNERPRNPSQRPRPQREAVAGVPNPRRKNNAAKNPSPRREPEAARPQPTSRRRRSKLYVENIEEPAPTVQEAEPPKSVEVVEPVDVPQEPVRVAGRNGDVGFETDDFDDFDMLDAESIVRDTLDADEERAFKPDRSAAVEEARRKRPEREPEPEPVIRPSISRERPIVDIPDEELRIEPQAYETPDVEIPFEIPSRQRVKKGELPKIKHEDMKVMFAEDEPEYNYPPIDLLESGEAEDQSDHALIDREKAQLLEDTLSSFGITAQLTGIAHGPAVTRFELKPAPGIKVSRITSLSDDIALNLAAKSVRIEAPIPGKAAVGVEIPNEKVEMVRLRDVLESQEASKHPSKIAVGLGKDNSGRYIVADIAKMPHVLIAGQTGSGKSVCINAIIASILFRAAPEEVRLILIDPKVVELSIYNDIPHLVCPVVTDPKKAASALDWAVAEMTRRYKQFAERGVRDIKGFNKALREGEKPMPQMVIIIDELADLMMVSPGEVEDSIFRIAQLARACGMHLVIATQRPSVNVITGIIKANIPTRIAFSVASQVDSRTMIDHGGAEKLLGNGDMLFVPNGMKAMRVQGAWVSDEEVHAIVEYIKRPGETTYDPDMIEHMENATRSDAEKEEMSDAYDPKLPEAVDIALELGQVSISMLQRKMRIGYARAGRLIDEMARRGIVSPPDGSKPRSILISHEQARRMFEDDLNDTDYSD